MNNLDPDVLDMIAKFIGVNVTLTLLLAVLSYGGSVLLLNGLELLDRRLDPSTRNGRKGP